MTYETYTAKVRGILWQGCKGWTMYDFDHLPTRTEVITRAGDFERVASVSLQ